MSGSSVLPSGSAGLHPQTLRIYEREGLVDPAGSAGGTRRYSRRNIGRMQEVCALTADGLNLAGIRRILELQEETRRLRPELDALRERAAGNAQAGAQPVRRGTGRGRRLSGGGGQAAAHGADDQGADADRATADG